MESLLLYKIAYLATIIGSVSIFFFVIFKKDKQPFSRVYALMNLAVIVWAAGRYALLVIHDPALALLWSRILYAGSVLIYPFFLHAILLFLGITKVGRVILVVFYTNSILVFFINFADVMFGTNLFIASVEPKLFFPFYENPGTIYNFHLIQYLFIPQYALIKLAQRLFKERNEKLRGQLQYLLFSSILSFVGGNSVVFLVYGIHIIPWEIILVPFSFLTMTYAIFRYGLMNFKTFATEIFAFLILILLLTQVVLSTTILSAILRAVFFLIIVFFIYLLVRSVNKEIETRERITELAKDLAKANEHLREIEQRKSEFVSIASHQLRTPLTAIKGYASMILEGSFGALSDQAREAVEKLFKSSQRLVGLVEDFLTVSRIERGKMQFDFTTVDIKELIEGVVKDLNSDAHDKGLVLTFQVEYGSSHVVRGDLLKLKQVLSNVIDNAIKFTNRGFVRILLSYNKETKKIRIAVSDTGAGMEFNTILRLFKRFDEELSLQYKEQTGMSPGGLGLYVSNQIIKAHGGTIWAQSEGIGKGSTFFVELPSSMME